MVEFSYDCSFPLCFFTSREFLVRVNNFIDFMRKEKSTPSQFHSITQLLRLCAVLQQLVSRRIRVRQRCSLFTWTTHAIWMGAYGTKKY